MARHKGPKVRTKRRKEAQICLLGNVHGSADTNVPLGGAESRFQPATKARLPSAADVATSVAIMSIAAPLVTVDALHDHVPFETPRAIQ